MMDRNAKRPKPITAALTDKSIAKNELTAKVWGPADGEGTSPSTEEPNGTATRTSKAKRLAEECLVTPSARDGDEMAGRG